MKLCRASLADWVFRCTFAALIVLFITASSPLDAKAKVFPAKGQDASRYQTYQWDAIRVVTKRGIIENDPDVAPLIKQAVNRELQKKGYIEVAEGGELTLLTAGLNVASSQLEGFLLTWGFDIYWGYGVNTVSPLTRVNNKGTILISVIDTETKKGVWTGYSTEALGRPSTLGKSIDKAASRLFKKFPKKKSR